MPGIRFLTMPPEALKSLVALKAKIDRDRVSVRHPENLLEVGVSGLTETELRIIRGTLLHEGFSADAFEVVSDPAPGKVYDYPLEKLTELLAGMEGAPDGHLAKSFGETCGEFARGNHDLEKTLRFIRDIRDKCVFCAGASPFVLRLFGYMLDEYPETEAAKTERHKELEEWAGM